MPSLETTVTICIVFAGVMALLHIFSNARAGVVLAHQKQYEEAMKPPPEPEPQPGEKKAVEPIEVG